MTTGRIAPAGFTLLEVLVAVVLLTLVAGVAHQVLLGQLRLSQAVAQRVALQRTLKGGTAFVVADLQGLSPPAGDILRMASDSISYRAMRLTAAACQVSAQEIRLLASEAWGYRQPAPGRDSVLLLMEGSPATPADDRWIRLPVLAVAQGASCGGRPAVSLTTLLDTTATPLSSFTLDAPAYVFEIVQIRLYQSAGQYWLGARSVSAGEAIQPVFGPFVAQGLTLSYLDSLGTPTTSPGRVWSVGIRMLGVTEHALRAPPNSTPAPGRDSLSGWVTLRNAAAP